MTWTINDATADTLKVTQMQMQRRSQAADVATLQLNQTTVPSGLEYGSPVLIKKDGELLFSGVAGTATKDKRFNSKSMTILIHGPWWYLENSPMLGSDGSGQAVLSGSIATIASDIISGGPYGSILAPGTIDLPDFDLPETTITNRTRAQALLQAINNLPNTYTAVDHTQTPAQLHILKHNSASITELIIDESECESLNLKLREDLQPVSVNIKYVRSGTKKSYLVFYETEEDLSVVEATDTYPPGATGNEVKSVELYQALKGNLRRVYWQGTTHPATRFYSGSVQWYYDDFHERMKQIISDYCGLGTTAFTIHDLDYSYHYLHDAALPGSFDNTNNYFCLKDTNAAPPQELLQAPDYLSGMFSAKCHYTGRLEFDADGREQDFSMDVICIENTGSGDTRTSGRTRDVLASEAETAPSAGMAQAMYEQFQSLNAEGSCAIKRPLQDIPVTSGKITLTDGEEALGSGIIQSITYNALTGWSTIKFGPPQQLKVQDFAALQNG